MTRPTTTGSVVHPGAEPAFLTRLPEPLRRLWDSPRIFLTAFVIGFLVSLGVGAAVLWRGATPERLLAEGRADQLLASLPAQDATAEQQVWRGHALRLKGQREAMLRAYESVWTSGLIDERALDNVIEALGYAKSRPQAVPLLVAWKEESLDERLSTLAGDGNHERRHGAVDALNARPSADAVRRLRAAIIAAIADTRSDDCAEKSEGIAALAGLVEIPRARPFLRELQAWKAVYDQNTGAVFDSCRSLNADFVRKTEVSLGAHEQR
jgi:hypothetical protein